MNMIPGPTYHEMLHPETLPASIRAAALRSVDEFDPIHLFNITWRAAGGGIRHVVLPKELTGVSANIIVLVGRGYPSGSHKVGAAYSTLMEGELAGEIDPRQHTTIGPSTGNFGIGVAYVSKLKGYPAVVVMPEHMSRERYERIKLYGGRLDLTPGSESDVVLVLKKTEEYKKDPRNKVLAQFELLPNYRFHRYVTGRSAIEAARAYGNGRIAGFVSAPGSAGTMAAGDEIKATYTDAFTCAPEPKECSTLFNEGRGSHRIEGIGDELITLIHNLVTTDYVARIHDDDCVQGLDLLERHRALLQEMLGLPAGTLDGLSGLFGVSGICNMLGAIHMARHLGLGAEDNVVTVATDGFDRYPSVIADLEKRTGAVDRAAAVNRFEAAFRSMDDGDILDVRAPEQKTRLFDAKDRVWSSFGYSREYLDRMKTMSFWDAEFEQIAGIDERLTKQRGALELATV